ncbi:MAG: STAS domain-containing protein [bacterium]
MKKYSMLKENGLLVVFPEAEITSRDYPKFEKKLTRDMLFRKNVVFNLEKVDSVNSQGIVFLLRIKDLVEMNGGYFAIYNPKSPCGKGS